ncbi:sigma-54 interaction domain-containing protein [Nitratireductor thuwali]|uniref:Transcriptional regulatory protein ZraR n=1 Tax=Nitratireductor thuwali TaxID=2267699 RepID=A0ABY5MJ37_9HYPH|nr:Transcriptional regulatory protein ZraR [Nitratireductor thuwali]
MSSVLGFALTGNGRVILARGIGEDPRVRALMNDDSWLEKAGKRRLQPLILDRKHYSVVVFPLSEGDLVLICKAREPLVEFLASVDFAYEIFEHLLANPFDAMTVVDEQARVVYISPVHEKFFGLEHGEANGKLVRQVIENTRLDSVVRTGKAEVGHIQKMRGTERVVSRMPILSDDKIVGAVGRVMFKGPEQLAALSKRVSELEDEVEFHKRQVDALRKRSCGLDSLIGESQPMQRLKREIAKIAPLEIPVLIFGESGTGKELVAQSLHALSPRRDNQMVMVNSAALPANLVEAELFGYEAGAFTGADKRGRIGKFEHAHEGTIFLDEIGDMPLEVQVKLLRVLQDKLVERVGATKPRQVDFRLITATNRDLQSLVTEGKFRLDLFYRITPLVIQVPPLRSRVEDIELLVTHFLRDLSSQHRKAAPDLDEAALAYLQEQSWPGNVRQLRQEIERAFVFAEDGRITPDTLMSYGDFSPSTVLHAPMASVGNEGRSMRDVVAQTETDLVRNAMEHHRGNKKRVAEELGISRSYLYKLLDQL